MCMLCFDIGLFLMWMWCIDALCDVLNLLSYQSIVLANFSVLSSACWMLGLIGLSSELFFTSARRVAIVSSVICRLIWHR